MYQQPFQYAQPTRTYSTPQQGYQQQQQPIGYAQYSAPPANPSYPQPSAYNSNSSYFQPSQPYNTPLSTPITQVPPMSGPVPAPLNPTSRPVPTPLPTPINSLSTPVPTPINPSINPMATQMTTPLSGPGSGPTPISAPVPAPIPLSSNPLTSNPLTSNPLTSNPLTSNPLTAATITPVSSASLPKTPDDLIAAVNAGQFEQNKINIIKETLQMAPQYHSGYWTCAKAKDLIMCLKFTTNQKEIMHLIFGFVNDKSNFSLVVECLKFSADREEMMKRLFPAPAPTLTQATNTPAAPETNAQLTAALSRIKQLEDEVASLQGENTYLKKQNGLLQGDQELIVKLDEENIAQAKEIQFLNEDISLKNLLLEQKDRQIEELLQKIDALQNPIQPVVVNKVLKSAQQSDTTSFNNNLAALLNSIEDII